MTLTIFRIFHYIYQFHRQLKANERFRITHLARNAAAYTKGLTPDDDIYDLVRKLRSRVGLFITITAIYCFCWYPLFVLTVWDYRYKQPKHLYRILTVLAWSHSALIPLTNILIDRKFSIILQCRRALTSRRKKGGSPSQQMLTMSTATSANNSLHGSHHHSLHNHTATNNIENVSPLLPHVSRDRSPIVASSYINHNSRRYHNQRPTVVAVSDFEEEIDMPPAAPTEVNRLLPDQIYEDSPV